MRQIGKYEILGQLGQGGMGAVYKGRDTVIGRDVAIKVIQEQAINAPGIKKRFYREAQSAGRLSHENITIIYDVREEDGKPFIVMEYLEGRDLSEILKAGTSLSNQDKLNIATQICRGLQFAHEQGVIHRDIKPANVRVLPSGRVKIMDFGIARIQETGIQETLTQTNAPLGTPGYMSPEQVMGEDLDRRSDIFSFGVLFYELFTGNNPFAGDRITTIIYKILHAEPQPINITPGSLSDELQPVIAKCLAKDRDKRYPDFGAVLEDLQTILARHDQPIVLTPSASLAEMLLTPVPLTPLSPEPSQPSVPQMADATAPVRQKKSLRKAVWAVLGVVLGLSLAVGGYLAFNLTGDTADTTQESLAATDDAPITDNTPAVTDIDPADTQTDDLLLTSPEDTPAEAAEPPPVNTPQVTSEAQTQPSEPLQDPPVDDPPEAIPTQEPEEPSSTGNQPDADRARQAMQTAKNGVSAALQESSAYQRALSLETRGHDAYDARAFDRAAARFDEATALFDEAAAAPTPEEAVSTTIQTLARRLVGSVEQEDLAGMGAVHTFYGSGFKPLIEVVDDISARASWGSINLTGNRAVVDFELTLTYKVRRKSESNKFNAAWTLEYRDNQWVLVNVEPR